MDTKSKIGAKAFGIWLCYFFSISIFLTALFLSGLLLLSQPISQLESILQGGFASQVQETTNFRQQIASTLYTILEDLSLEEEENYYSSYMQDEAQNLVFYGVNSNNRRFSTNTTNTDTLEKLENGTLPAGFNYLLQFDGYNLTITKNGHTIFAYGEDYPETLDEEGYFDIFLSLISFSDSGTPFPEQENCMVFIAVNENPTILEYSYTGISGVLLEMYRTRGIVLAACFALVLGVILLIVYLFNRKSKKLFYQFIAQKTGRLWFDFKILFSICTIALCIGMMTLSEFSLWLFGLILFWYLVFCVNDIRYNPRGYRHNIVNSMIKRYRMYENKKPFQKMMVSRFWFLIGGELTILTAGAIVSLAFPPFILVTLGFMVYLLYRYNRRLESTVRDMGRLIDQISQLKEGNSEEPLYFPADADMHAAAENLNNIQAGINKAVEEQIKSERMKIELITNVSHDIKTPLTSIIGYVDLLKQEPNLPDYIQDYIKILSNKSERLKNMVQDIFDISKASTGNISLDMEALDLGKLLQQTLADMNEEIDASRLAFRVNIPDTPIYIMADGRRLYRVFQNLIKNALQYSLEGSRVYICLSTENNCAVTEMKNTSKYEIDQTTDITERFVRGDQSRSTEGSGLGLSIAQSFTEACGGSLKIKTIADLFCATVVFPLTSPPAGQTETPIDETSSLLEEKESNMEASSPQFLETAESLTVEEDSPDDSLKEQR